MSKNIVIVGATSDIAESAARIWAEKNADFFLIARNGERLQSLGKDLEIRGAGAINSVQLDVRNTDRYNDVIDEIDEEFPSIDIVLIAHGSLSDQEACEKNILKAAEEFNVNATSVISLCLGFAELMKKQQSGTIAVISSVAGDRGRQSNFVYGAAKGALNTFLQGLRNRLYHHGAHVITIKPGPVDTKMTQNREKNILWAKPSTVAKKIVSSIEKKKDIVYVPGYWRYIMMVIKAMPEKVFKRLRM